MTMALPYRQKTMVKMSHMINMHMVQDVCFGVVNIFTPHADVYESIMLKFACDEKGGIVIDMLLHQCNAYICSAGMCSKTVALPLLGISHTRYRENAKVTWFLNTWSTM